MNIYLDINGVLLADNKIAPHADEFLQALLTKYPDSTYQLVAHDSGDEDGASVSLTPYLKPETVNLLKKIKQAPWTHLKTDVINLDHDFLWFDDDIWPSELKILEKHEAAQNFIMVNFTKDPDLLAKLAQVIRSHQ